MDGDKVVSEMLKNLPWAVVKLVHQNFKARYLYLKREAIDSWTHFLMYVLGKSARLNISQSIE